MNAEADAKVTARSGTRSMIIRMGVYIIMEMVFKRKEMLGCAISGVKSVGGILPIHLDLMLLGSVILALLPFHITMNIGSVR